MAAFDYEALDLQGRTRRGVITAESARLARRELRQNKLVLVRLQAAVEAKKTSERAWLTAWTQRVRSGDLMLMTRQLATMIAAAAPLEESLQTVAMQTDSKALRSVLFSLRAGVNEGQRLADAMARHPRVFSPMYRAMIAAGEMTGSLGAVLERLADHLEKADRMGSRVLSALIYPMVLAAVAGLVIVMLLTFVVPKVVEQFDSLGQELPLLTRGLIALSDGLATFGLPVLIVIAVVSFIYGRQLRHRTVRHARDRRLLRTPVIGNVLRRLYAARMARTIGTLIGSGVPALEAIAAARATVPNVEIADKVSVALTAIREGASISAAFRKAAIFPPLVVYMTAVGENSGRLDAMLEKAAEQLERELENATTVAVGLLEPAIIVVMGGIVGLIVMAILMPIFQLNSLALM